MTFPEVTRPECCLYFRGVSLGIIQTSALRCAFPDDRSPIFDLHIEQ